MLCYVLQHQLEIFRCFLASIRSCDIEGCQRISVQDATRHRIFLWSGGAILAHYDLFDVLQMKEPFLGRPTLEDVNVDVTYRLAKNLVLLALASLSVNLDYG